MAPKPNASPEEKAAAYGHARALIIAAAELYLNTPYKYGGIDRDGLDCSGLVYISFLEALGISVPRKADSLYVWTERIQREEAEPGDLLFFRTTGSSVSHVGIFIGNEQFIHSASDGLETGVIYSGLDERYWSSNFVGVGRVLPQAAVENRAAVSAAPKTEDSLPAAPAHVKDAPDGQKEKNLFTINIGAAPAWNIFGTSGYAVRGAAVQLGAAVALGHFGIPVTLGLELRPEWDGSLNVFRLPVVLSAGLGSRVHIFAGPVFGFGTAEMTVSGKTRRYLAGSRWFGAAGICVDLFTVKIAPAVVSLYGELAWQSYISENEEQHFTADLAACLRFSTGLSVKWII